MSKDAGDGRNGLKEKKNQAVSGFGHVDGRRNIEPGEIHYVINNSGAPMKMISTLAPYTNPDKVDVENYTY